MPTAFFLVHLLSLANIYSEMEVKNYCLEGNHTAPDKTDFPKNSGCISNTGYIVP